MDNPRPPKSHRIKLDAPDLRMIVSLYQGGFSMRTIGERFGVSVAEVSKILLGMHGSWATGIPRRPEYGREPRHMKETPVSPARVEVDTLFASAISYISAILGEPYDSTGPSVLVWQNVAVRDPAAADESWAGYFVSLTLIDAASDRASIWIGQGVACPFTLEQKLHAIRGWAADLGITVQPHPPSGIDLPQPTTRGSSASH